MQRVNVSGMLSYKRNISVTSPSKAPGSFESGGGILISEVREDQSKAASLGYDRTTLLNLSVSSQQLCLPVQHQSSQHFSMECEKPIPNQLMWLVDSFRVERVCVL